MEVSYARTPLPKSIFLAGPTPRPGKNGEPRPLSWRPEAIELLRELGFTGTVFVPEDADWSPKFSYDDQVDWELQALNAATVVVFWIPRTELMPAFTTNVEYGMFISKPNTIVGAPPEAEKMKYLQHLADIYHKEVYTDLRTTLAVAIAKTEGWRRMFPSAA